MSVLTKDISIIIQGPIYENLTDKTVKNIHDMFPGCEIIVSTWAGSNYKNDLADVIVESQDPGGWPLYDEPKILNACNRQIVSTLAGLKCATRKYALKIRSDMGFHNTNFLNYWQKFTVRSEKNKILTERVLLSTRICPNPHREPKPYHPSDWFFFGLTDDLFKIFNSPLCPEPETSRYFETHPRPKVKYDPWVPMLARYSAEQYIWIAFLRRYVDIDFKHAFDIGNGNIENSEQIFANNTVFLEPMQIGYDSYKYEKMHTFDMSTMYTHTEWLELYKKYCDKNCKVPWIDKEKIRRMYISLKYKQKRKWNFMSLFGIKFKQPE